MEHFLRVFALAICLLMLANIFRGVRGPTVFDRILGMGLIGSKTAIVLLLIGFMYGRIDFFVDCALAYCVLNFVGMLTASKYFIKGGLEAGK